LHNARWKQTRSCLGELIKANGEIRGGAIALLIAPEHEMYRNFVSHKG